MLTANKPFNACFVLLILSISLNFVIFPNLIIVQLFSLIYFIIIYKMFAKDVKSLFYYATILFAFINSSLVLTIGSHQEYYFHITLIIYYCMILLTNIKVIRLNTIKNKYTLFLIVFLLYSFFSIKLANDKIVAIQSIINYIIMFSLSVMFMIENKNKIMIRKTFLFLKYIFIGILLLGTLEVFGVTYGINNHFIDMGLSVKDYPFLKRVPVVFFYNPNDYAVVLVLAIIMLIINTNFSKVKIERLLDIILIILAQINLIFTTCRIGWITLITAAILIPIFYFISHDYIKYKSALKILMLIFFIFILFSILPSMKDYYGKFDSTPILRVLNIKNISSKKLSKAMPISEGKENSGSERLTLLIDVTEGVFKQGHILGYGAGNIENFIKSQNNTYGVLDIHSLLFEILGDFGVFICIYSIYIFLRLLIDLIAIFKKAYEIRMYYLMMIASLFAFIFLSFAPSSVISTPIFWILIGISTALAINS